MKDETQQERLAQGEPLRVTQPCPKQWEGLTATEDAAQRFCDSCSMCVVDVSAMTERAARRRLQSIEGRICIRSIERSDGTVVHRKPLWRASVDLVRSAVAASVVVVTAACGGKSSTPKDVDPSAWSEAEQEAYNEEQEWLYREAQGWNDSDFHLCGYY